MDNQEKDVLREIPDGEQKSENIFQDAKSFNRSAIISLLCSALSIYIFGIPLGIASVILGLYGFIKFDVKTQKARWIAVVSIISGIFSIVLTIIAINDAYKIL